MSRCRRFEVRYKILLIDDNKVFLGLTQSFLERNGFSVDTAQSGDEAVRKVKARPGDYALAITDFVMEGKDGAKTTEALLEVKPDLYILVYSADNTRDAIKSTWRAGAVEFIDKGADPEVLLGTVKSWCQKYEETRLTVGVPSQPLSENERLISSIGLVGRSEPMARVALEVMEFRTKKANVLILGESGTGKERIAQALHRGQPGAFRPVNCATYSGDATLMESELFGVERGAFTGANVTKKGIFEDAHGGTVFLDEIHTLSLTAQQKLLRALQERTIRPVGSTREIAVKFRLIAASKPDLEEKVKRGEFLPDLFYRLNVLHINVPALRERPEDIEPLVGFFCHRYGEQYGEKKRFLARTVRYMEGYSWPGNVRELENEVERLCARSHEDVITPEHLDGKFFSGRQDAYGTASLEQLKRENVEAALRNSPSLRAAARKLGIAPSSMHFLVKKYGLRDALKKGAAS